MEAGQRVSVHPWSFGDMQPCLGRIERIYSRRGPGRGRFASSVEMARVRFDSGRIGTVHLGHCYPEGWTPQPEPSSVDPMAFDGNPF